VAHVDFNLLIALDALLEENSVAAAADRLHLSPPAMSRTLARIRQATGDDILVRTGRTMTPTPRALELREETRELVRRGTAVLAERGLRRQVIAALPTAAAALDLAARTDLVTAVTGRVCRPAWTRLGLRTSPLPFGVPPVPVILSWHHRNDSDPAHAWLRDQVRTALLAILDVLSAYPRTRKKAPGSEGKDGRQPCPSSVTRYRGTSARVAGGMRSGVRDWAQAGHTGVFRVTAGTQA
jgi:DNA-binding transcriptional LysR family regulator